MFHANGWTFTWTVTAAAGTHICLRMVDPATVFGLIRDERVARLCAAPTVLISLAGAPAAVRGEVPPGVRVITAGAPPAAATIERLEGSVRLGADAGLRPDRDGAVHHGLRAAARARGPAARRPRGDQGAAGRRAADLG